MELFTAESIFKTRELIPPTQDGAVSEMVLDELSRKEEQQEVKIK